MKTSLKTLIVFALVVHFHSCAQTSKTNDNSTISTSFNLENSLVANGYIKIPMTKEISGHLLLMGSINGVDGTFVLDTGAGATVIEQTQKGKFKMKSTKSENSATGAGGAGITLEDSENNELILSSLKLENKSLTLMDLSHVNDAYEALGIEKIDGVIGADILTDSNAIIDYKNLVLYLKK